MAHGLGESEGSEADNISCGKIDREDDDNDTAMDERIDGRLFIEVGEGGGDVVGMKW